MKCIALVVMMALAAANAGVITKLPVPYEATYPLAYPYAPSFSFARGYPGPLAYDASPFVYSAPIARNLLGAPIAYTAPIAYAAPAVVAAPAQVTVGVPKATYKASNPGVTHEAELPGHLESVIAENLEMITAAPIVEAAPAELPVVELPKATYIASNPGVTHEAELLGYSESVFTKNLDVVPAAPIVEAAPIMVELPKASYIASNPGVTHEAELPGYSESVITKNLELAPGTF